MMMRYQDAARHVVSVALTHLNTVMVTGVTTRAAWPLLERFCPLLITLLWP